MMSPVELDETAVGVAPRSGTVVSVEGSLDAAAAAALCTGLASVPAGEHVVLDFRHARVLEDIALATLVGALRRDGRVEVRFRGLSQHHERMLRYLGMDPAAFGLARPGVEFPVTS